MPPFSDTISMLPDALLCLILSKIPIKEAIRCSILSKRWRFLYTQICQITLSPYLLLGTVTPDPLSIATVENIISNILLLHSSDLEAFHLSNKSCEWRNGIVSQWRFNRQSISKWVQYAAWRNIQRLTLCDSPVSEIPPPALFSCNFLTELTLSNYILSHLPAYFSGFSHLITCDFTNIEITDDSLARFISLCPLLQNLKLRRCKGLWKPVISAPKLITMEAYLIKDLRVNGVLLHEFSNAVYQLKMQPGTNLIKLSMNLYERGRGHIHNFPAERFLEIVGSFKTLKELDIGVWPSLFKEEEWLGVPLYKLLERLPNLEGLGLRGMSIMELARDNVPARLSSPLVNLQFLGVDLFDLDKREVAVVGCLLQSTPALKVLDFNLPSEYSERRYTKFLKRIQKLKRASTQARLLLTN